MQRSSILERLYKRRVAIILSVLLSSAVLIYSTYHFFGHSLVSGVYYEKSFSFLSSTMPGRGHTPIEYYFAKADGLVRKLLTLIFALSSVTLFYAFSRKFAFFINRKFYLKEVSAKADVIRQDVTERVSAGRLTGYFFVTLLIVAAPLWFSKYPPLLDYPWHLARIYILDNWDKSPLLQSWYDIMSFNLPNVGVDLRYALFGKDFSD